MSTKLNPNAVPPAKEGDARTLFEAKMATLTIEKPEAENALVKKRGDFLTRRFFSSKDKNDSARKKDNMAIAPKPPEPLSTNFSDAAAKDGPTLAINTPAPPSDQPVFPEPRIIVPSIHRSQTNMTPIQTTNDSPAVGRASAQLTLGFEITSLQLTPFFRLGAVRLKALSNVVSLGLIAAQQVDNPLAAGISFQVKHVELDGAEHFKSILLKPLGEAHEMAVPRSRLQVDNVEITREGGDAPISVTTSGANPAVVQLIGMFTVAAMEFTSAFEIDSLRLEPVSDWVLLRVASSSGPNAQDVPLSFEIAQVQLGDGSQIHGAHLIPSIAGNA